MNDSRRNFKHPYDTAASSGLRFTSELIAWIAGPWAVSLVSVWLVPFATIILLGLPSVFSTVNDKRNVVIPIPGVLRIGIEFLLYTTALVASWFIWPFSYALCATVIVTLSVFLGLPRLLWLLKGAPSKAP